MNRRKSRLLNNKGRKQSSAKWLQRHMNDKYVALSRVHMYRSRAAYKLLDIIDKYDIFCNIRARLKNASGAKRPVIVDIGCAPGSWMQIMIEYFEINAECQNSTLAKRNNSKANSNSVNHSEQKLREYRESRLKDGRKSNDRNRGKNINNRFTNNQQDLIFRCVDFKKNDEEFFVSAGDSENLTKLEKSNRGTPIIECKEKALDKDSDANVKDNKSNIENESYHNHCDEDLSAANDDIDSKASSVSSDISMDVQSPRGDRFSLPRIVGVDLLSIEGFANYNVLEIDITKEDDPNLSKRESVGAHDMIILKGDFFDDLTQKEIKDITNNGQLLAIVSDLAPNATGMKAIDQLRISQAVNEIIDFVEANLLPSGTFIAKILTSGDDQVIYRRAKSMFEKVYWHKSRASYSDSSEMYIVCINKL